MEEKYAYEVNRAPLPTSSTLRMRKNLVFQFYRFAVINLKMVKMILKGHH